jgi:hypothetical protein
VLTEKYEEPRATAMTYLYSNHILTAIFVFTFALLYEKSKLFLKED